MDLERLTATEARVAGLVAAGYTNREVAAELALRPEEVRNRLATIYRKLGARSRTELVLLFGKGADDRPRKSQSL